MPGQFLLGSPAVGGLGSQFLVGLRQFAGALANPHFQFVMGPLQRLLGPLAILDFARELQVGGPQVGIACFDVSSQVTQGQVRLDSCEDLRFLKGLADKVHPAGLEASHSLLNLA